MSDEKLITLADILDFDDTACEDVKAFGGLVHLRSLPSELYAEYLSERESPVYTGKRNLLLAVYCMFTDEQRDLPREDRLTLAAQTATKLWKTKNIDTLSLLVDKSLALNGLRKEQKEERKNVSSEAPSDASLTV